MPLTPKQTAGLLLSQVTLGLGNGGMERMMAYPILIWGAGFGGYILASKK